MTPSAPAFRALLLATVAMLPIAVAAQQTGSPSAAQGAADAIRVLLDQANYWRSQYQPQRADEALERVLALDPNNADALAQQAQAAADRGNQQAARAALAKLEKVRPDDPRIASVQQALQMGPIDPAALADARRLGQAGMSDEAVAAYRRAFKGDTPPPSLAIEYYQTAASTDAYWQQARDGLSALVRANPQDLRAQLAYAQVLTYREGTREDGVDRLAALSQQASIKAAATKSWRDGLLWSGDDERAQNQLETFLKDHPSDPQLDQRRADLKASVPDEGARDRLAGYQALESKNIPDAEKQFEAALKFNGQDVESLVMMAAIRRVQHKEPEVQRLLAQAKSVDADRAGELIAAVGLDKVYPTGGPGGNGGGGGGDYGIGIRRAYANVEALTRRGEYATAEAELRKLMGKKPAPGSYVQLGYIQLRAGQLTEAEASFRRVLSASPRNVAALNGLASVLSREGNADEANAIYAKLGTKAAPGLEASRAESLRTEARAAATPEEQIRLYRLAIAADPADPWVRLDLARVLQSQNQPEEAREVMAQVSNRPNASVDQLRAGIYYADLSHDYRQALVLTRRLPAKAMTPEMREVAIRAEVGADLDDAISAGGRDAVVRRMEVLAARPDPNGARGVAFAQELIRRGDKRDAREVIRYALAANRTVEPTQRIAYAQMLVAAGYPRDAQIVTAGLQPGALNPLERSNLTQVQNTSAAFVADNLNNKGKTADAYDELAPRLAQDPENPTLNLALGRLYQAHGQPAKALAIDEALLQRDPENPAVVAATVNAALAAGYPGRAAQLVAKLKEEAPDDPQTWMVAAQLARSRGDNGTALADLRQARALRKQQIDSDTSSDASDAVSGWVPGKQYALNLPANLANDASPGPAPVQVAAADEPVIREYEQYAQTLPPILPTAAAPSTPPYAAAGAPIMLAPLDTEPTSQADSGQGQYNNPFRSSFAPTLDEPGSGPLGLLGGGSTQPRRPADPLTADIDRSIQDIQQEIAPQVSGTLSLRGRTGTPGLAELLDLEAPLEASFSPNGYGRLKVTVTPTYLFADKATASNQALLGTNPLVVAEGGAVRAGKTQSATGAALDVSYSYDRVTADIGTSPLGFNQSTVVGGVDYAPKLTGNLTLRFTAERRAVTDSLLSFAGLHDPATGTSFGGVTRDRGHVQLEGASGDIYYYAGAGGGYLSGSQVASNSEIDAGAGVSFPVYKTTTQELRTGVNLVYFGYDKNLDYFSLGNGGYFSPQQFFAALFPLDWKHQVTPQLSYGVGGSVGVQSFRAKSEPVFINNAGLQRNLVALAATNTAINTENAGFSATGGIAGGAHANIDYAVYNNFHIGGSVGFDHAGNFTEGTGLVYARYVFTNPQPIQ